MRPSQPPRISTSRIIGKRTAIAGGALAAALGLAAIFGGGDETPETPPGPEVSDPAPEEGRAYPPIIYGKVTTDTPGRFERDTEVSGTTIKAGSCIQVIRTEGDETYVFVQDENGPRNGVGTNFYVFIPTTAITDTHERKNDEGCMARVEERPAPAPTP